MNTQVNIPTQKTDNQRPSSHQLDQFADELNAVRERTMAKVGQTDANYIRNLIRIQRLSEISGRILIVLGFLHPAYWVVGVLALATAKILDNMEIGHNVMHGQYDWMNDPNINSRKFEWDIAGDSASWKRYHNHEHHTYTNIIGKDRDFGYGLLRLSDDTRWKPKNLWQFFTYLALCLNFEWGIAYHEVAGERIFMGKPRKTSKLPISRKELKFAFFNKAARQLFKDYVFYPLICFPVFLQVLAGNFIANLIRNVWTNTIIFCGHFTENIHTFKASECKNETQGEWFYRQILGSSNLEGSKLFHIMTGHLSCQMEHHLFPDVPARHYPEMAKEVRVICAKYNIPYNSAGFFKQFFSVVKRIIRYSFPTKKSTTFSAA
jgi:fatty acid desaturase